MYQRPSHRLIGTTMSVHGHGSSERITVSSVLDVIGPGSAAIFERQRRNKLDNEEMDCENELEGNRASESKARQAATSFAAVVRIVVAGSELCPASCPVSVEPLISSPSGPAYVVARLCHISAIRAERASGNVPIRKLRYPVPVCELHGEQNSSRRSIYRWR